MTYADKYALLKAYKIVTGEDPDQQHSPDTVKIGEQKINDVKVKALKQAFENKGLSAGQISNGLNYFGYKNIEDIKENDYMKIYNAVVTQ